MYLSSLANGLKIWVTLSSSAASRMTGTEMDWLSVSVSCLCVFGVGPGESRQHEVYFWTRLIAICRRYQVYITFWQFHVLSSWPTCLRGPERDHGGSNSIHWVSSLQSYQSWISANGEVKPRVMVSRLARISTRLTGSGPPSNLPVLYANYIVCPTLRQVLADV